MGKNKQQRKEDNRKAQLESSFGALTEYASKLDILQNQISKLSSKVGYCQRQTRTAELALKQISDEGAVIGGQYFVSLGRGFLQEEKEDVVRKLERDRESAKQELPLLTQTLSQFEMKRKEVLEHIKEVNELTRNYST